ncbi:dihydroorotate dehydrogenase (fumarate) [Trichoderma gamsii]|uniref:Dihydroorotate dehydrogenase (fumarate) n=1 Tax=Trichoderma gamsii TaxID=398673 RepID=A0A2P4ZPB9_9HYPO|nr:dihydroorotate dehydrogenase (fumarate) [Trichoderma gamsii]PON26114.1 dihydroorotate dehydrogenase (fumarate) [Trichoderma gamsii]
MPPKLSFRPPLLNTASPWATTESHLRDLLLCPSTGAVTTRTSLINGFPHSAEHHRYAFFDPATGKSTPGTFSGPPEDSESNVKADAAAAVDAPLATLNTLGYSPLPLSQYLSIISSLSSTITPSSPPKTIIISVTGSPAEISSCHNLIQTFSTSPSCPFPLAMEINLSCPNIPNLPPPAYSPTSLASYFDALPSNTSIPIGIKIPPYTHAGQFDSLISSLLSTTSASTIPASKLSFLTATNTLGSCILLDFLETSGDYQETLPGEGIGGMAGPPLHPLALGNVATLRRRFDQDPRLAHLEIIGVGGVYNGQGYKRMRHVGARAVGIATALGRRGVEVFTSIEDEIKSVW